MIPEHDTAAKFDQKYHELEEKMKKDSWFYGQLSRIETESIFRSADFDRGVYLLRKKADGEVGKNYVLSIIRKREEVKIVNLFH